MRILSGQSFSAIALIVDINGSAAMVRAPTRTLLADFTRDVLAGGIQAVEDSGGAVVAIMGDAFLAVLPDVSATAQACVMIARDLDRQCEWISNAQDDDPEAWPYAPGGPSLKIAFESGEMEATDISTRRLGTQLLLIGEPIIYSQRISAAGTGNRCVCGPQAAHLLRESGHVLEGPTVYRSTKSDEPYTYFTFDLGDVWVSDRGGDNEDSYWG